MDVIQFMLISCIVIVIGSPIYASCPEQPNRHIKKCSADTGIQPEIGDSHNLVGNFSKARQICKSNKLTQAIDCIKKIMDDCSDNQKKMKEIKQLINIQGWKVATKYLCGNIDYLEQNQGCMEGGANMSICIEKEIKVLKTEAEILKGEQKNGQNIVKMNCEFVNKMVKCIIDATMKLCPEKMLDSILTATYGFVPPKCTEKIPPKMLRAFSDNSSGSIVLESAVIVFLTAVSSGFLSL